jgi:hypothetical protein
LFFLTLVTTFFEALTIGSIIPFLHSILDEDYKFIFFNNIDYWFGLDNISRAALIFGLLAVISAFLRIFLLKYNLKISKKISLDLAEASFELNFNNKSVLYANENINSIISGIAQNFLATEIILPDDKYNSFIVNLPNFIRANKYIFINPRTMVLDSLQNIVDRLNATQCEKVLIAKEQGIQKLQKLGEILDGTLTFPYSGSKSDLDLLGISEDIYNSTEVYNGGVFACGHKPLLVINSYIKNNEFKDCFIPISKILIKGSFNSNIEYFYFNYIYRSF